MNIKKIILIIAVIVVAFIGYSFLISGKKDSATGVTKQNVSTGSSQTTPVAGAFDGPGKEFVTQLLAIQNIKFNLSLFDDPVFKGLKDWHQDLIPQESGRPNPFAPLEGDTGSTPESGSFSGFSANSANGANAADTSSASVSSGTSDVGGSTGTGLTLTSPSSQKTKSKTIKK